MGFTSTRTRLIQEPLRATATDQSGPLPVNVVLAEAMSSGSTQVTTSYRTNPKGGGAGEVSSEDQAFEEYSAGSNYRERFKALKDERTRTGVPKNAYDTGHPFKTEKQWLECSYISAHGINGQDWEDYSGPVWPDRSQNFVPWSTYIDAPSPDLGWYGPKAISATIPTNPAADVAIAVAELWREGIPSAPGQQSIDRLRGSSSPFGKGADATQTLPGSLASEHLNVEFGWKPLISDVRRAAVAVKNGNAIIRNHMANSGQNVRRRYTFPTERTISVLKTVPSYDVALDSLATSTGWKSWFLNGVPRGSMVEELTVERDVWFSGAYTYQVTRGKELLGRLDEYEQKANLLLGTRLTPDVLWNISPWSWLADWKYNIGDNIHNAVQMQSDGLVLRYGYLMVKTTTRHTSTLSGPNLLGQQGQNRMAPFFISWNKQTLERVRASPFGFGSNPQGFSLRQWSILGALGMTRGDKTLRLND